jgi:hypothetical protein
MTASAMMTVAGMAIWAWAFWRLNETSGRGEWCVKFQVMCVFASVTFWLLDRLTGNAYHFDGAFFMLALAAYLWWGVARHLLADRRRRCRRTQDEARRTIGGSP